MLIHDKIASTRANGPGNRAGIWVQGCSLGCKGCWNPNTHLFNAKQDVDIFAIEDWILGLKDIEGVTWSGGEPMQQAPSLWLVMKRVHEQRPDLSFGMYTGYTLGELQEGRWKWKSALDDSWVRGTADLWLKVKEHLDFAILGRYNQLVQVTDQPLIGSANQKVEFFTDRYSQKDLSQQVIEFTISPGKITTTGFPVGISEKLDEKLGDDEQGELACV